MPFTPQGYWYPELSPKQLDIFNTNDRYVLASGPKKSGKTIGTLHRIVRHGVDTPRGRVGMFARTVKNAKAGGIWNDILDIVLPEWIQAGQTQFTTKKADGTMGPKQDAQTRMVYFRIRNQYGGETEFQLHSIDNENEVESIAKGTRFSCFYFSELSNFRDRLVFDITSDQLRMPNLPFRDHLWIADTNPSDEGPDSWIHDVWYKLPQKEPNNPLVRNIRLIEVMIEQNPYLSTEEREDLYARFAHDPDLAARYLRGEWVRASKDAIFAKQFNSDLHVLGTAESIDEDKWEVILPQDTCYQMLSGWDLGDRWHSAHIIEPIETMDGRTYCVIDEICMLDRDTKMGLSEFAESFMLRYDEWMKYMFPEENDPKQLTFQWTHWSDQQALLNFRAGAETYDKNLIYKYTEGKVFLQGAPKFPKSISKRINLTKILLHERRLLISARCKNTIAMFKSLRAGTGAKIIADGQPYRHVFDSLTYALSGEEPTLLMQEVTERGDEDESGGVVTLPLQQR